MNHDPTSNSHTVPAFSVVGLAESANEKLEQAVNDATHQAFNLGCLIGLLPAVIFAVIMFLSAGFSVIGATLALVLGVVSAIAFANLAAMITRNNTVNRTYNNLILPEIESSLANAGIEREVFDAAAREYLPPSAALFPFIGSPVIPTSIDSDGDEETRG